MFEKICIVGTHHDYQLNIRHPQLFQDLSSYIEIHSLQNPLVAEEATENNPTVVKEWALSRGLVWLPVELDGEFRKQLAMDQGDDFTNPVPFTDFREWVWLIRIMRSQVGDTKSGSRHIDSVSQPASVPATQSRLPSLVPKIDQRWPGVPLSRANRCSPSSDSRFHVQQNSRARQTRWRRHSSHLLVIRVYHCNCHLFAFAVHLRARHMVWPVRQLGVLRRNRDHVLRIIQV